MSPDQIGSFFALAIGFAVAGLLASTYQLVTGSPASFRLLNRGPHPLTIAAVPLLAFAAPFIIMRNTIRACCIEGRGFSIAMVATLVAGGWSLMSGTVLMMAYAAFAAA
jgi:predicted phage tail protein